MSGATGHYQFLTDLRGDVTLTPQALLANEQECRQAITAADAARIAKSTVQLLSLSACERLAADVTANGTVSSYDAALVAEKASSPSCTDYLLPIRVITGSDWVWVPDSKTFTPIMGGENYDFTGILWGDVTENWAPTTDLNLGAQETDTGEASVRSNHLSKRHEVMPSAKATLYVARAPQQRIDGTWEVLLGLKGADGILGLDLRLEARTDGMVVESVTPTGIASSFAGLHNRDGKDWLVSLFGAEPMEGQGAFIFVVYTDEQARTGVAVRNFGRSERRADTTCVPPKVPDDAERLLTRAAEVGALSTWSVHKTPERRARLCRCVLESDASSQCSGWSESRAVRSGSQVRQKGVHQTLETPRAMSVLGPRRGRTGSSSRATDRGPGSELPARRSSGLGRTPRRRCDASRGSTSFLPAEDHLRPQRSVRKSDPQSTCGYSPTPARYSGSLDRPRRGPGHPPSSIVATVPCLVTPTESFTWGGRVIVP